MSNELKPGQVLIHGNVYDTVARRVSLMRKDHPDWQLKTKVLSDDQFVVVKATLSDGEGRLISTGHAEEDRSADSMNETSAMENCETSAVGRCLAFSEWPGSETDYEPMIRSADEMTLAIRKQHDKAYGQYMALVHEHWDSIVFIKNALATEDADAAMEVWHELGKDVVTDLWKAPTKGGIFTTKEREQLKAFAVKGPI